MNIFRENSNNHKIKEINYQNIRFEAEVKNYDNRYDMHSFFIANRNEIFGEYIFLLHEEQLSQESSIDFIGFNESGAVLLIEIKRGEDMRNRQEVISQIGKYALDSFSIYNLIIDRERFLSKIENDEMINKKMNDRLVSKIENNIKQNNINLFLFTEDATDEVLTSCYFISYGQKFHKITVIEMKRIKINDEFYCIVKQYNKQQLLNSNRKGKANLANKIDKITNNFIREEIKIQIDRWEEKGFVVSPLTVSTPEYFTFYWENNQSAWVSFYVMKKRYRILSDEIKANSIVFQIKENEKDEYAWVIKRMETFNNYYKLESKRGVNKTDYTCYCVEVTDYESNEIEEVFKLIQKVAVMRRDKYYKNKE